MTTRDRAYGFAVVFLLASALVGWGACGGDGGGAAGGGGTDAVSGCPTGGCGGPDIRDERRDLSFYFADGELLDISTSPFPRGNVPASATEEQREAVQRVNWFRWRVGVLPRRSTPRSGPTSDAERPGEGPPGRSSCPP